MWITSDTTRGVRVLVCQGALNLGEPVEKFGAAARAAIDEGIPSLVLDLTRVTALDSAGVGALVAASKRAAERGCVVKIALLRGGLIRRLFEVTQLERAFDIFDDADAAARSFR